MIFAQTVTPIGTPEIAWSAIVPLLVLVGGSLLLLTIAALTTARWPRGLSTLITVVTSVAAALSSVALHDRVTDAMRGPFTAIAGAITPLERAFLLAAFLYSVSYVSNTSGVFKGFHNGWGGKNGTALYRILSDIRLRPPIVYDNSALNVAAREDAQSLAPRLRDIVGNRPDVVYLDPPYNQHPYGSNYHVLNTITLLDKPPLNPSTSVDGKKFDKSAIRKDWRTERRSLYNSSKQATGALRTLVESIDARWILLSYSTDGNVPLETGFEILASRGHLSLFVDRYKRYRVSPTRPSPKSHNAEFVAVVDLSALPSLHQVEELTTRVLSHEVAPGGQQLELHVASH